MHSTYHTYSTNFESILDYEPLDFIGNAGMPNISFDFYDLIIYYYYFNNGYGKLYIGNYDRF